MDGRRFDTLARTFDRAGSRRRLVRAGAGGLLGLLAAGAASFRPSTRSRAIAGERDRGHPGICGACDRGEVCVDGACCPQKQACWDVCCPAATVGCIPPHQLPDGSLGAAGCLCPDGFVHVGDKCVPCTEAGERCRDDAACCSGACCDTVCCPAGAYCCAGTCCTDGHYCLDGGVCCLPARVCGGDCCARGEVCHHGGCCEPNPGAPCVQDDECCAGVCKQPRDGGPGVCGCLTDFQFGDPLDHDHPCTSDVECCPNHVCTTVGVCVYLTPVDESGNPLPGADFSLPTPTPEP